MVECLCDLVSSQQQSRAEPADSPFCFLSRCSSGVLLFNGLQIFIHFLFVLELEPTKGGQSKLSLCCLVVEKVLPISSL